MSLIQMILPTGSERDSISLLPMIVRLFEVLDQQERCSSVVEIVLPDFAQKVLRLSMDRGLSPWRDRIRLLHQMERAPVETIYCADRGFRAGFAAWKKRAERRVGYSSAPASFFYTDSIMQKWGGSYPEIERKLDLLRVRWPNRVVKSWDPLTSPSLLAPVGYQSRSNHDPVVMITITNETSGRYWPVEQVADFSRRLVEQGVEVWLVGDLSSKAIGDSVQKLLPSLLIKNLCKDRDFEELVNLMCSTNMVVSTDLLSIHVASDVNLPVIALCSASVADLGLGPWRKKAAALGVVGLRCDACDAEIIGQPSMRAHHCARDISADRVYREARRFAEFLS